MNVLAIIVFITMKGDLVNPMTEVFPTVHECHVWQHEQAMKHIDLGAPYYLCVNTHGRQPNQPKIMKDDPREIKG